MSNRRLAVTLALASVLAAGPRVSAQRPSLDEVLTRAAVYVADFRRQLAGIVAEETYRQEIAATARISNQVSTPDRTLKSDLVLIKPPDSDRYVELRDVFEVDGRPVRTRGARLESLLRDPSAAADATLGAIITESAAYNIGSITRNINTPLMALQFLEASQQSRFRFKHIERAAPVFGREEDTSLNDAPVFRVSTEMWTIEYAERGRNTIIRRPDGSPQPAHGRFWINPSNGSVLISELIVDTAGVIGTVTVSYQSEPLVGFLVPVEMRESYIRYGERISGHAQYGRFRQLRP